MEPELDHKTHILIGIRASRTMTILWHWPKVPAHAEVQERIDATKESFTAFLLCTPKSILSGRDKPDA
jgi:hypothetical protein